MLSPTLYFGILASFACIMLCVRHIFPNGNAFCTPTFSPPDFRPTSPLMARRLPPPPPPTVQLAYGSAASLLGARCGRVRTPSRSYVGTRFLHTGVFGPVLTTPSDLSSPSVLKRFICEHFSVHSSEDGSQGPSPPSPLTLGCRARLRQRFAQLSSPLCSDEHLYENQCLRRRTARDRIRICCVYSVFTVLLCVVLQL